VLVGGVAAGWATEYSEIRLELVADDPKAVEIALVASGVSYAALPPRANDAAAHLSVESPRVTLRLVIVTPLQRRNRPRKSEEPRLTADAVAGLIASVAPPDGSAPARPPEGR
jgi:hypothetical protein